MAEINGEEKRIGVSGEQIEEAVGKVPTIEADVKSNKQNISALQTASAQHTADIARNTADIEKKANADEVYSREETDNAITAKVAEIVAGAPEEFDTLKEMSDWLTEHSGSAAEMNTAIQANTKAIADNATAIEGNTADIKQNISDILSISNETLLIYGTLGTTNKNLFNKNGIMTNEYISSDGTLTAHSSARLSDYIRIDGKPFVVSAKLKTNGDALRIGVYDENKNFVKYYQGYNKEQLAVNDSRAVFVRICIFTANYDINTLQLELGTVATAYEPYKSSVNERLTANENNISKAESEIEYNKIKWGRVLASGLPSGTAGWYKIASCELAVPSESTTRNATFLISHHSGTWGILKTHIIINPSNVSKFVMTSIMQGINIKNIIGIAKRENNVQKCEIWCKCTYAGEYYRFVILDNGSSGIPNNYNEFWQLHSTTAYQTNEPSDYDNKAETTDVIKDLSDRITALENK